MAHYPKREVMDSLQLGQIGGQFVFARYDRPYDDDPHTTAVGPVTIDIVEPYKTVHLHVGRRRDRRPRPDASPPARARTGCGAAP